MRRWRPPHYPWITPSLFAGKEEREGGKAARSPCRGAVLPAPPGTAADGAAAPGTAPRPGAPQGPAAPRRPRAGDLRSVLLVLLSKLVLKRQRDIKMSSSVPADMINLRLILVSGKTKEFLFSPNDSAADIAKHVYDNWPMDWEEEQVSSPNILRLIYQGRFLHGNVTLGALKLPFGKTTVMHLVARETLPEPNSQGQRNREKTGESNCCVIL